ncbi:hypothetical protein KFK09_000129 [Dendrobium nobile]|uniref:Uncharacterized protein n=1 Tax=Dendrobium nobile TaxID=94219 RepID=A0A8T3CAE5_DENNO|nr:hypothetical protein KFK09_000129 [Dendrobium nobile]
MMNVTPRFPSKKPSSTNSTLPMAKTPPGPSRPFEVRFVNPDLTHAGYRVDPTRPGRARNSATVEATERVLRLSLVILTLGHGLDNSGSDNVWKRRP